MSVMEKVIAFRIWLLLAPILLGAWAGVAYLSVAGEEASQGGTSRYAPQSFADRILLVPGADASREMAVAFRTDVHQKSSEAEIALAPEGPDFSTHLKIVRGSSHHIETENGEAIHHHIRFTGLQPDTPYVYRVRGADGWSEWFPFRTPSDRFEPFRFLYFGDVQNDILSKSSRVIRQAFTATTAPALALHAGDLVNRRLNTNDDEWGEWFEAIEYNAAIIPQLPAAGNHEYVRELTAYVPHAIKENAFIRKIARRAGFEELQLGQAWTANFALPNNGPHPKKSTSYYVDYQGVRFVVLDGTGALLRGSLLSQSKWLEKVLSANDQRWTIVLFHQPLFTCHEADPDRNQDRAILRSAWEPILTRNSVDLVLQGHDHCYGRINDRESRAEGNFAYTSGPVYIVSVVGTKMYSVEKETLRRLDRAAERTQLYQVIDVTEDQITLRAYTATGQLYDKFDLVRTSTGQKYINTYEKSLSPTRLCDRKKDGDATLCSLDGKRAEGAN